MKTGLELLSLGINRLYDNRIDVDDRIYLEQEFPIDRFDQ